LGHGQPFNTNQVQIEAIPERSISPTIAAVANVGTAMTS
jgi:hypothetical protein